MVKTTGGSHGGDKMSTPTEVKAAEIQKISAKAAAIKSREYPSFPSSYSGGNIPMTIQSRFTFERQRLTTDFTDKWRKWRVQWIKDQTLHPAEPLHVKELEYELYNPIRRFIRAPWNYFELKLAQVMHPRSAHLVRRGTTTVLFLYASSFWLYYIMKYHQRTWEDSSRSGWPMIWTSREGVYPGDPAYPSVGYKFSKEEFADQGFSSRKALLFKEPAAN